MKVLKRLLSVVLIMGLCAGVLCGLKAEEVDAATKPATPKISLEATKDGTGIKISISKTKNAEGYRIYLKSPGSSKSRKVQTLKKNGKSKRSYTIEHLTEGTYCVYVDAYKKEKKKTVYSAKSTVVSIDLKRYTASSASKYAEKIYPKLKDLADKSLISFTSDETPDTIKFGKYNVTFCGEYYHTEIEKEARELEWEVLEYSEDGKSALVISKYIIAEREYSTSEKKHIKWEDSSLRKWLNEDFLKNAFSKSERALIMESEIENKGAKNTKDKLYLLSKDEVDKYFYRGMENPDYNLVGRMYDGTLDTWFLRDEGSYNGSVSYISYAGKVQSNGAIYKDGVRPVFRIKITPELKKANNLLGKKKVNNVYVNFGKYAFKDSNGKKGIKKSPIEWRILDYDEKNGKALLVSRYALEKHKFNETQKEITWEESDLRKWLRDDFYDRAFSKEEKDIIAQISLNNKGETTWYNQEIAGSENTRDKIFLLSPSEINKYFFVTGDSTEYNYDVLCSYIDGVITPWWLRTTNKTYSEAFCVNSLGSYWDGVPNNKDDIAVRPVLYIELNALDMLYAAPDTPEITINETSDNAGIELTVEKTEHADGYHIYMKAPGKEDFEEVLTITEDGTERRRYVFRNLEAGEYTLKATAYRVINDKETVSEESNVPSVNLEGFAGVDYAEKEYPKISELADKGVLGFDPVYSKDTIKLGTWKAEPFYNDNKEEYAEKEKTEIEWVVLDYSEDKKSALVISKNILFDKKFHDKDEVVTWDNCTLRKWLNEDFYKEAFTDEEKSLIRLTDVKSEDNKEELTSGGEDTKDYIYMLSISETIKYFNTNKWNGYNDMLDSYVDTKGTGYEPKDMWLRSPGRQPSDPEEWKNLDPEDRDEEFDEDWMNGYTAIYDNRIDYEGCPVVEEYSVRPVMWVELTPDMIEKNNLSLNNVSRSSVSELYVDFGAYVNAGSTGRKETLKWDIAEYDEENGKALLVLRTLIAKDTDIDAFTSEAFTAQEKEIISEVIVKEEEKTDIRPAVWIKL